MSKKQKLAAAAALIVGGAVWLGVYLASHTVAVLQPQGSIGQAERRLIITAVLLSLIVIIPVYIMLAGFSWKYREGNKKAVYNPKLDGSRLYESIWWGVPLAIITILAVLTWNSSRQLDPFKPISSKNPAMTVQVVSLQWKWLFIYPKQRIATVNYLQIPTETPINFEITSDAPMNSYWIPQLGGQIYAMSGMATHLSLVADKPGTYYGSSANISGEGFAGMKFEAKATTASDFEQWVKLVQQTPAELDPTSYNKLAAPDKDRPISYYGAADAGLFDSIIRKYEAPLYFTPPAEER